jgi:hypothetical protein
MVDLLSMPIPDSIFATTQEKQRFDENPEIAFGQW